MWGIAKVTGCNATGPPLVSPTSFQWGNGMKGWLSLLIALAVLGYGCTLISTQRGIAPCGLMFDLTQQSGARWERDDVGRPQAIVEALRAQQRLLAAPCDP
jgi:hypothetical protein